MIGDDLMKSEPSESVASGSLSPSLIESNRAFMCARSRQPVGGKSADLTSFLGLGEVASMELAIYGTGSELPIDNQLTLHTS